MPDARIIEAADANTAARTPWHARLALQFRRRDARTLLVRRAHEGPLVVQKALYPEGDAVCHCIVIHPPGGIAGGDSLQLDVDVASEAFAQLTTPGATKWYRAGGRAASSHVAIRVADGAVVEWMPQGTIVYHGAQAAATLAVNLHGNAMYIGWDVVCLGRTASAERFDAGEWRQRVDVRRDDALIWSERALLAGASTPMNSLSGLNGAPVFGTFMAVANNIDDSLLAIIRGIAPASGEGVVTRFPGALIARYRGHASSAAQAWFIALWTLVRPALTSRPAIPPRIWNT
jgi:urease accessory protein